MTMGQNTTGNELRRLVASLLVVRASGHLADAQRLYPCWESDNATLRALRPATLSPTVQERLSCSGERRRAALGRTWGDPAAGGLDPGLPLGPLTTGPADRDRALADELLRRTMVRQQMSRAPTRMAGGFTD